MLEEPGDNQKEAKTSVTGMSKITMISKDMGLNLRSIQGFHSWKLRKIIPNSSLVFSHRINLCEGRVGAANSF